MRYDIAADIARMIIADTELPIRHCLMLTLLPLR